MSGLRLTLELAVGNLNNYIERTHVSVPVDTLLARVFHSLPNAEEVGRFICVLLEFLAHKL